MPKDMPSEEAELDEAIEMTKQVAADGLRKKGRMADVEVLQQETEKQAEDVENRKLKDIVTEVVEQLVADKLPPADTQISELEARIDQKLEDLKSLLLRARAQGKARINIKEEDKDSRLKEIYGDIIDL